jgi:hypothetical protein
VKFFAAAMALRAAVVPFQPKQASTATVLIQKKPLQLWDEVVTSSPYYNKNNDDGTATMTTPTAAATTTFPQ